MKKLVMFDFDGVICDSFDHGRNVRKELGEDSSAESYQKVFEGNIVHFIQSELGAKEGLERIKNFFEIAGRDYHALPYFEGMLESIATLSKDYTLAIVSSTINSLLEKSCEAYSIRNHFSYILGSDIHASKVEKIKMLRNSYDLPAESCVFITDTLGDVLEANHAGVDAIAVLWGFHPRETLERGRVTHFVNSPQELTNRVDTHFSPDCDCKKPKV